MLRTEQTRAAAMMRRAHQRLLQLAPVGREACSADALRARQHAVAPPRAPDSSGTAPAHSQREREREGETRCVRVAGYTYARCVGLLFPQPVCEKIKQNRQNASWLAKKSPAALRMSHPNRHYHPRQPLRRVATPGFEWLLQRSTHHASCSSTSKQHQKRPSR